MQQGFYLESSGKDASLPRQLSLDRFPALIGRHPDCTVNLSVDRISRRHARIEQHDAGLVIEDLGSTNGTYVNHQQINAPTALRVGDVLHLADHEFRLMLGKRAVADSGQADETMVGVKALPRDFPLKMSAFLELLDKEQVTAFCQPIVTGQGRPFGQELLGRSAHPGLDGGVGELFALASALDCEVRLSRLLRRQCFAAADRAGMREPLFFNNHPAECEDLDDLMAELHELRKRFPDLDLVFEVHESAVTDLAVMGDVKRELAGMGIALAYDDFGAGQARLLELAEVPPDFLKFDMALVRDLVERDSARYRMLESLNSMIRGMGVRTLVEGVELDETVELCREIGIDFMQGFHFGRPRPLEPESPTRYHHTENDSAP
ncbi:EAL domain-containing protein [Wenzhouxiangella sp. AB-CW3]|uniref:EAL domain-containing protein n=1 Tax=Wenzhouxiangella sp. AB-CW3 TaxID=2771012 RepID=UPI00168B854A|nr:EAL domain-containing protein [Wenzhouxiangella sp. AB-CW3]QOC21383.1 EAL domain-containing protein [Wenzhouxiangella sp. AB-CW3]